eukprot:TRINITY_DN1140_c0_g1_i5.p1 TRINITY_DN1140_c0_g1~~TRINITY_DN1140_c0_g1_i5.p1  ORF type:complete len:256 (+),score=35.98 TRINITY_DN1140_c0_g1_i5:41-808(+)
MGINLNSIGQMEGNIIINDIPHTSAEQQGTAPLVPNNEAGTQLQAMCPLFTFDFYRPLFNVTTADVRDRLLESFLPLRSNFFQVMNGKPDLYGPFWVYTSLIFMLAAAGNLSRYLSAHNAEESGVKVHFKYDFNFVPFATSVVYGFGFFFPLVLNCLLNIFGSKTRYIDTLCLYGYATAVFVPVAVLAAIPVSILEWLLLMYAAVNSSLFLMGSLWSELSLYVDQKRFVVITLVGIVQFLFVFIFKLRFFRLIYA